MAVFRGSVTGILTNTLFDKNSENTKDDLMGGWNTCK